MKGCVCFCWTCCNGHIPVGGGLCWAITWPRGTHAFTQHTQGLSRHVSHSQSYSTDWAEVRWREAVVRRGGANLSWNSKDGCYFQDGKQAGGFACSWDDRVWSAEKDWAVFGAKLFSIIRGLSLRCCQNVSQLLFLSGCLDSVMMQIVERRGKCDAQMWNCGALNAL